MRLGGGIEEEKGAERVKVNLCCHSETGEARFSAQVGDTVLVRTESGYGERQIEAIEPDGSVAVRDPSGTDLAWENINSNDIVALMLE